MSLGRSQLLHRRVAHYKYSLRLKGLVKGKHSSFTVLSVIDEGTSMKTSTPRSPSSRTTRSYTTTTLRPGPRPRSSSTSRFCSTGKSWLILSDREPPTASGFLQPLFSDQWKGINHKQSTRWQHPFRLKASVFFSLQNFLVVMKHSNLYLGLVLPSGGRQSLIFSYTIQYHLVIICPLVMLSYPHCWWFPQLWNSPMSRARMTHSTREHRRRESVHTASIKNCLSRSLLGPVFTKLYFLRILSISIIS